MDHSFREKIRYTMFMNRIKYSVFVLLLLSSTMNLQGQQTSKASYFGKVLYIGASVSPLYNVGGRNPRLEPVDDEFSYIVNVAVDVAKHWAVGLEGRKIYYNVQIRNNKVYLSKEQFYQVGGFVQYFIRPVPFNRSFIELGLSRSDYCACGAGYSYRRSGSIYASLAVSTEWRIYRHLYLELGITFQRLLNPPENEIGEVNTPIWGLTYHFQ